MNHKTVLLVLALVSLIAAAGLEYGPATAGVATPPQPESASPPSADEGGSADGPDGAAATVPRLPPAADAAADDGRVSALAAEVEADTEADLRMQVVRVEACGSTCRDVTANLHNDGALDLTNVEVYTTIYAGDAIVWVDAERVGTVAAGDTYTTTKRVRIGAGDVLKIHSNGGEVTVKTVLEFDQGSEVVTEQIDVV